MKVVSPQEMARIEASVILQGASEVDFMLHAGEGIAAFAHQWLQKSSSKKRVLLACSKGHNSGDAYAAGAFLKKMGYDVYAIQTIPLNQCKPLCQKYYARFVAQHGIIIDEAEKDASFFASFDLILDGFFGTGFKGPVEEPYKTLIENINASKTPVLAIDIPSGLNGLTGEIQGTAIKAAHTVFLGLPKIGFFLRDGWNAVGHLHAVNFGLSEADIEQSSSSYDILFLPELKAFLPPLIPNRHKYQAGYVVGVAGSPDMPGAALLSSMAALRTGAGMMRLFHLPGRDVAFDGYSLEVIKSSLTSENMDSFLAQLKKASAVFVGPGLGQSSTALTLLRNILPLIQKPCVLDADALNLIAENDLQIPSKALLTPHFQELKRLLKQNLPSTIDEELLEICQNFVDEKDVTLVLKGGPSFLFHPHTKISINPYGDPGMATGGMGDVFTGILAAFLAQGLPPYQAAALSMVLHSVAGEIAAEKYTSYGLIASDIFKTLPEAFKRLMI